MSGAVKPLLIYVAGPYRAKSRIEITQNIVNAMRVGVEIARAGAYPVIPHANTPLEFYEPDLQTDDFWLSSTLELMRRCDAVVLVPNWEMSSGSKQELAEANRLGKLVCDPSGFGFTDLSINAAIHEFVARMLEERRRGAL